MCSRFEFGLSLSAMQFVGTGDLEGRSKARTRSTMTARERYASSMCGFSIDRPPTTASTRERARIISAVCLRSSKNVDLLWSLGVHSGRSSRTTGIPNWLVAAIELQMICTNRDNSVNGKLRRTSVPDPMLSVTCWECECRYRAYPASRY